MGRKVTTELIRRYFTNGFVSYYPDTKSVYVDIDDTGLAVDGTVALVDNVLIDYDVEGNIVGVEVLL